MGELLGIGKLKISISDGGGANIASGIKAGMGIAIDNLAPQNYVLYIFLWINTDKPSCITISSNGLSVVASNEYGTITIKRIDTTNKEITHYIVGITID